MNEWVYEAWGVDTQPFVNGYGRRACMLVYGDEGEHTSSGPDGNGSWVEERIRVNDTCVHVVRKNLSEIPYLDSEVDADILRDIFFFSGQRAYGEWFKRLSEKDKPPRGKCQKFFNTLGFCKRPTKNKGNRNHG